MPRSSSTTSERVSPEDRITALIAAFKAKHQQLLQTARKALRKRFPAANELVYDYTGKVVIGYSPTEAGGEGLVALSLDVEGVRLYLTQGAKLPDPYKLLQGKAGARYLVLASAKDLQRPELVALFAAAEKQAKVPLARTGRGALIIKAGAAKKKARKKAAE